MDFYILCCSPNYVSLYFQCILLKTQSISFQLKVELIVQFALKEGPGTRTKYTNFRNCNKLCRILFVALTELYWPTCNRESPCDVGGVGVAVNRVR